MKGTVLNFSVRDSSGVISGSDGKRYRFEAKQWGLDISPEPGIHVDFDIQDGKAMEIYEDISAPVSQGMSAGVKGSGTQKKTRTTAALWAFFLGGLGAHKFYLGYQQEGLIMLLVSILGSFLIVPTLVMGVIGFAEFIIYLTKDDRTFVRTYVTNKKAWF